MELGVSTPLPRQQSKRLRLARSAPCAQLPHNPETAAAAAAGSWPRCTGTRAMSHLGGKRMEIGSRMAHRDPPTRYMAALAAGGAN